MRPYQWEPLPPRPERLGRRLLMVGAMFAPWFLYLLR